MKKISLSKTLCLILSLSIIVVMSACSSTTKHKQDKKYDEMATFILENGVENNGKYSIEKNLSELGNVWKDCNTIVIISYEKSTGHIIMEETTKYDDYVAYKKAVCDKNKDEVNVSVIDKYKDREYYYKGYILKSSFSGANIETAIYGFDTNSAVFGESNAKVYLGLSTRNMFGYISFLLKNVGCPVTLNDIKFQVRY